MLCFGIRLRAFRDGVALESRLVQRADGAVWSLRADIAENHVIGKIFPYVNALLEKDEQTVLASGEIQIHT